VVLGAGATVLGPVVVGAGARIGAGSVVVRSVPPGATIVGVPGHLAGARRPELGSSDLEHGRLPDPVLRTLAETLDRQGQLEERLRLLERAHSADEAHAGALARQRSLTPAQEADIRQALRQVIDPEIGLNVVDLGLIRKVKLNGRGVEIHMMTCAGCSLVGHLVEQVRREVRAVVDGERVEVVLMDETWSWNCAAAYFGEGAGI
jgi:serine O-acetyltransferase